MTYIMNSNYIVSSQVVCFSGIPSFLHFIHQIRTLNYLSIQLINQVFFRNNEKQKIYISFPKVFPHKPNAMKPNQSLTRMRCGVSSFRLFWLFPAKWNMTCDLKDANISDIIKTAKLRVAASSEDHGITFEQSFLCHLPNSPQNRTDGCACPIISSLANNDTHNYPNEWEHKWQKIFEFNEKTPLPVI